MVNNDDMLEQQNTLLPSVHRRINQSNDTNNKNPEPPIVRSNLTPKSKHSSTSFHQYKLPLLFLFVGFICGYYAQVIVFFSHVRLGFKGEILPTWEVALSAKQHAQSLIEETRQVIFVCARTNWDFVGFIATPHSILFAHEDVLIPPPLKDTLTVVRHGGVDSYMNLHNKTLTIISHIHKANEHSHLFKQDDEAVIFWPHYYDCMKKCTNLSKCYAGDMHVNIGDAANANSYVFATGGSYFVGNELLKCLLASDVYVELEGLDFGEDKTVGKMLHYNNCQAQIVSCKWFNNKEIYSPNAHIKMRKSSSNWIEPTTVLLSEAEQLEQPQKWQNEEKMP